MLLAGKKGIIMGLAGRHSLAWHIGRACMENGAKVLFSCQNEAIYDRNKQLLAPFPLSLSTICDVSDDNALQQLIDLARKHFESIDFIVHSVAYAPIQSFENNYLQTDRQDFAKTMDISCYSFTKALQISSPIMNEGSSALTLSYLGGSRVVPGYNLMGVAKAALEASVRYLAYDLGPKNIRVNCLRLGPFKTIAGRSIKNFDQMYNHHKNNSILQRAMDNDDATGSALFLLSNLSSGISAEIINADLGYKNVVG